MQTKNENKKAFLLASLLMALIVAFAVMLISMKSYYDLQKSVSSYRDASAAYIQYLEDALDSRDPVYMDDVACETDAYINYYSAR